MNNIPVFNSTDHIEAFRNLFYPAVAEALESKAKREKLEIRRDDMSNGMLIYNITRILDAKFDSQSKTRLTNTNVLSSIRASFDPECAKAILKACPEWGDIILQNARDRQNKKDDKEVQQAQKKNRGKRIANIIDATGTDRLSCALFLVEGKSAKGFITSARDPKIHGSMELRGKVMNVFDVKPKDVIENAVLNTIMTVIGLEIGKKADRYNLNYGKLYLAMDQDVDGHNITALLINFFYWFWPELFDSKRDPFIYKFETPFIIAKKGSQRKYYYASNVDEFMKKDWKGWEITRAKGLAALEQKDWEFAINTPVVIPVLDDGKLKDTLDVIFNPVKADERKLWLANDQYHIG